MVYDITNAKSFDNIAKWLRNIGELKFLKRLDLHDFQSDEHANEDVERMILGNKADMEDKRVVSCQIFCELLHICAESKIYHVITFNFAHCTL